MTLRRIPRAAVPPEAWDAFVDAHPSGWNFHRSGWLDYGLDDGRALGDDREDLSFAVVDDAGTIVGLCPLIREGDLCTFQGEPGAWPLATELSAFWEMIEAVKLPATFRSSPLVEPVMWNLRASAGAMWHQLRLHVRARVGWHSRVLDLTQSEGALHAGLRGSYKALINRTGFQWRIVGPGEGIEPGDFEAVHRASVGFAAPRPPEFYSYYARLVEEGRAFLVGAQRGSHPWAAEGSSPSASTISYWGAIAFIFIGKGGAYYGSGPSLVPGTMHAVLWRAILAAKARGLTRFELGWGPRLGDSEKTRAISFFKQGFGGDDVPVWVLEAA